MQTHPKQLIPLAMFLVLAAVGCEEDENRRLAEMSERHEERQAEQNRNTAELHRKVVELQREIQAEQAAISQQRDRLETERQFIATQRRWDSLVAAAITNIGLLLACSLPLALAWLLLARPPDSGDEQAVVEIMLDDLTAKHPLLLNRIDEVSPRRLLETADAPDDAT